MKRLAIFLLLVLVILLVMVFTVLNTSTVEVDVYFYQATIPVSVLIFVNLLIGAVLGVFVSMGLSFQHRVELRKLRKQLAQREQELSSLSKIPTEE